MIDVNSYPPGFEEDHHLRSTFMLSFMLHQVKHPPSLNVTKPDQNDSLPKTLIRYWHDPRNLPEDVSSCMESWSHLRDQGFDIQFFDDISAASYIEQRFSSCHLDAFRRCRHPAMRSDYLRLCYIFADGGFYVDVDDVLLGDGWKKIYTNNSLKLQPLCYDISSEGMVSAMKLREPDIKTSDRIFYSNNNPIAANAGHPVLQRALKRATKRLLSDDAYPEIQETTGPGNMTSALVAHLRESIVAGIPIDVELLFDWDAIAETRWELSYRNDARNWRNMEHGRSLPEK